MRTLIPSHEDGRGAGYLLLHFHNLNKTTPTRHQFRERSDTRPTHHVENRNLGPQILQQPRAQLDRHERINTMLM